MMKWSKEHHAEIKKAMTEMGKQRAEDEAQYHSIMKW